MLELDLGTIAFQIANFVALTALLYYLLFRPTMRRVQARRRETERLREEIADKREENQRMRAELEARLANAEEKARDIIAEARKQIDAERESVLEETEREIERILNEARSRAQRLQRQQMEAFRERLLNAILEVAGQAIGNVAPEEVHDRLTARLSERIWDLGEGDMDQVSTFRLSLGDRTPTAHIVTARELSLEQQGELARTLTALADRHVSLEIEIDPAVIAGIRVRRGDMIVDSSIAGQLDNLRDGVAEALRGRLENGPESRSAA
jgi:F0F1-type ATP synthase membrane subunit b/b'